jgi:hypothetical protein
MRKPPEKVTTLREKLFGHAILILACVVLPGFCMLIAPLSVVQLTREDGSVRAEVSKRVWFIIPYRHQTVAPVVAIGDSFHSGEWNPNNDGNGGSTRSEDSATLVIHGPRGDPVEVEVSPVNIHDVVRKADDFLEHSGQSKLRLIVVANWKFGVFAGGFLSLLTLFYLFVLATSFVHWLRGGGQRPAAT